MSEAPYIPTQNDLTECIERLERALDIKQREIDALLIENRQLREYTGSDTHIAALHVTVKERNEMITGLRRRLIDLERRR